MRASKVVWLAAGSPSIEGTTIKADDVACLICNEKQIPLGEAKKLLSSGFSDFAGISNPDSSEVCAACLFVMAGMPPKTFRMWTTLYGFDAKSNPKAPFQLQGVGLLNRSDTSQIIQYLLNPPANPWFIAVAQSGKLHILPFTKVNTGLETVFTVRFDAADVRTSQEEFQSTLNDVARLRSFGFSADEITSGRLHSSQIQMEKVLLWKEFYPSVEKKRTSPLVALCLWLLTKEAINEFTW